MHVGVVYVVPAAHDAPWSQSALKRTQHEFGKVSYVQVSPARAVNQHFSPADRGGDIGRTGSEARIIRTMDRAGIQADDRRFPPLQRARYPFGVGLGACLGTLGVCDRIVCRLHRGARREKREVTRHVYDRVDARAVRGSKNQPRAFHVRALHKRPVARVV